MSEVSLFQQQVNQYRAFSEANYVFACQAAVPLLLTPDLLYQLWNNFKHYQYSFDSAETYRISHLAVSDLLLSPLCHEIGHELYELQKEVRELLLCELVLNLGEKRKNTIAAFLNDYASLDYHFTRRRNLKNIHLLTAQSILDPAEMETQLIDLINKAENDSEKINYLLLHHNLMPVGYESDLRRISAGINDAKNKAEWSPILITEDRPDIPGSLHVSVHLPTALKSKIKRLHIGQGVAIRKEVAATLQSVKECFQSGWNFLNLSGLQLQDEDFNAGSPLDSALQLCTHLRTLIFVENTALTRLPEAVFHLTALEELHFTGPSKRKCGLTLLPDAIEQIQNLKVLDLSNNSLVNLPAGIGKLVHLIRLNVHGNELTTIPSEVGQLLNLVELDLADNNLQVLPRSLQNLARLRSLLLHGNPLADRLQNVHGYDAKKVLEAIFPPTKPFVIEASGSAFGRYGIGGKETRVEAAEAFADIPSNRTLFVLQLTRESHPQPNFVEGLTTLSQVFEHYKPEVAFQNKAEDGAIYSETMRFGSISDFSLPAMTAGCKTLRELKVKLDLYGKMGQQFRVNKLLRAVLSSEEYKASFVDATKALSEILKNTLPHGEINPNEGLTTTSTEQTASQNRNDPDELLTEATEGIAKFGGFGFLESTIEHVSNLNPDRKARRSIFLGEPAKAKERQDLFLALTAWINIAESGAPYSEMIDECELHRDQLDGILKENLRAAVFQTKELETTYRSLQLFFSNVETDKVKNITFLNATFEQLFGLDDGAFVNAIRDELQHNYDLTDLRKNYSLLIVPGYLGSNRFVHKLAKKVHEYKVLLVTDFANVKDANDAIEFFEEANLTGGEAYLSHVVMVCNWLIGRRRYMELDEEEDLFIPPSPSLGGKIYSTLMSQVSAAKRYGGLNEVEGVRFDLRKSEIAMLERSGLVPMVREYGKVMALSAKTLFNGDNLGMQTYSVVRVFDYISKVLIDLLNRRAFENFTPRNRKDLQEQIVKFLDSITGPSKLIEKFSITRLENDDVQKDKIHLDILLTPYFPAKTFMLKLEGYKGDDGGQEWQSEYAQQ